jgi:hypothetical protein
MALIPSKPAASNDPRERLPQMHLSAHKTTAPSLVSRSLYGAGGFR